MATEKYSSVNAAHFKSSPDCLERSTEHEVVMESDEEILKKN